MKNNDMLNKFINLINNFVDMLFPKNRNMKMWYYFFSILFFILMMIAYLINIDDIINDDDIKLPSKDFAKKEIAVRGSILTADNFDIAKSTQVYKVTIDTRFLDPNKEELFIELFSIYSNIEQDEIRDKINKQNHKGKIVLSYNIDSRVAANLNELATKLIRLKVFVPLRKKSSFIIGMDIAISGDKRVYQYDDSLTPLAGYIKKYESKSDITRLKGVKGIERFYDKQLNGYQNGLKKGPRDAVGNIVFNKSTTSIPRLDGKSIKLNIPLKLQRNIEFITNKYKKKFEAREILVSIMDSKTGKILSLATSNRYNPKDIKQDEVGYLNLSAIEYQFEPGSVIKPIIMALVFDKNRVQIDELLDAYNNTSRDNEGYYRRGKFKIDKFKIGDDHNFKKRYITPEDIIVYSSNIGIAQLAQRLKAQEFIDGFKSFKISEKTNIDLPYEKKGLIHSFSQYSAYEDIGKDNIYKATDSYGQGITATFMQVLTAYSVFNNDGKIVTPQVALSIIDTDNKKELILDTNQPIQIIQPKTANIIKDMLIKTVQIGTGVATKIERLKIGGKTGTAQIPKKGQYKRDYISSFFGFANDSTSKYTIGVTVFEPNFRYHYASTSAAVVYRDVVNLLLKQGYLKLSDN